MCTSLSETRIPRGVCVRARRGALPKVGDGAHVLEEGGVDDATPVVDLVRERVDLLQVDVLVDLLCLAYTCTGRRAGDGW